MTTSDRDAPSAIDPLQAARARIAYELLEVHGAPLALGDVRLYPHQRRAVARLAALLTVANGAMLADATGLGKTFVALAIAANFESTLIIAPATLMDAWRRAIERTSSVAMVTSMEMLSRGATPTSGSFELIVIDEAHHFRNSRTRRYAAAASLCEASRVLLLSATPLQNRRDDLVAQLALFLGDAALTASDTELARYIVRRRAGDTAVIMPRVSGPHRLELPICDDLLDELLALPPPVPGSDEGEAGALVAYTLLRQWASSRAALAGALRRRLTKATALIASLETGRWPARDELLAWSYGGDSMQLAMPELFATSGSSPASGEVETMLATVRCHADGLQALLNRLRATSNPDAARVELLERIAADHQGGRVIAFSQYAETVRELSRLLMPRRAGVAELTAHGGRIAGGRISRREVLAQFAPGRGGGTSARDCITMLITTDVLSEGLDLQGASVVVHLDLPWNPARLEQRVGRIRRLGSRHEQVFVYVIAPPASSERLLRVDARLRAKLRIASEIVGLDGSSMAGKGGSIDAAPPELASDVLKTIETWRDTRLASATREAATPVVAGVAAPNDGLLALVSLRGERVLLAMADGELSLDASVVATTVAACHGPGLMLSHEEETTAIAAARGWCHRWESRQRLNLGSAAGARSRDRVSRRIAALLASAPRHEYAQLAALASRARRTLRIPLGIAAERALAAAANAPTSDAEWLRGVANLSLSRSRDTPCGEPVAVPLVLVVLRRSWQLDASAAQPREADDTTDTP